MDNLVEEQNSTHYENDDRKIEEINQKEDQAHCNQQNYINQLDEQPKVHQIVQDSIVKNENENHQQIIQLQENIKNAKLEIEQNIKKYTSLEYEFNDVQSCLQKQIKTLQDEFNNQHKEYQSQIKQYQNQIDNKQSEIEKFQVQLQKSEQKYQKLQEVQLEQNNQHRIDIESLIERLQQSESSKDILQQELQKHQTNLDIISKQKIEIESYNIQLSEQNKLFDIIKQDNKIIIENLDKKLKKEEQKTYDTNNEKLQLEQSFQKQLNEKNEQLKKIQNEINQLNQQLISYKSLEQKIEKDNIDINDLKQKQEHIINVNEQYKIKVKQQEDIISQFIDENTQFKKQVEDQQNQIIELKEQCWKEIEQKSHFDIKYQSLQEEIDEAELKINLLESKLLDQQNIQKQNESISFQNLQKLQNNISSLNQKLVEDKQIYEDKIQELDNLLQQEQHNNQMIRKQEEDLNIQIEQLNIQKEDLEKQIKQNSQQILFLDQLILDLKIKNQSQKDEITYLIQQIDENNLKSTQDFSYQVQLTQKLNQYEDIILELQKNKSQLQLELVQIKESSSIEKTQILQVLSNTKEEIKISEENIKEKLKDKNRIILNLKLDIKNIQQHISQQQEENNNYNQKLQQSEENNSELIKQIEIQIFKLMKIKIQQNNLNKLNHHSNLNQNLNIKLKIKRLRITQSNKTIVSNNEIQKDKKIEQLQQELTEAITNLEINKQTYEAQFFTLREELNKQYDEMLKNKLNIQKIQLSNQYDQQNFELTNDIQIQKQLFLDSQQELKQLKDQQILNKNSYQKDIEDLTQLTKYLEYQKKIMIQKFQIEIDIQKCQIIQEQSNNEQSLEKINQQQQQIQDLVVKQEQLHIDLEHMQLILKQKQEKEVKLLNDFNSQSLLLEETQLNLHSKVQYIKDQEQQYQAEIQSLKDKGFGLNNQIMKLEQQILQLQNQHQIELQQNSKNIEFKINQENQNILIQLRFNYEMTLKQQLWHFKNKKKECKMKMMHYKFKLINQQKQQSQEQLERIHEQRQQELALLKNQRIEQDDLIQSLQKSQIQLKERENQLGQLNISFSIIQEELYQMEQKYENKILSQKQKHESQIDDLHKLIQELKQQLNTVESEGRMMQNSLNEMEILDFKCKELKTENEELKLKIQELLKQPDQQKIEIYNNQIKEKSDQINELNQLIQKQKQEHFEIQQKFIQERDQLNNIIVELKGDIQDQKKLIIQQQAQIQSITLQYQSKQNQESSNLINFNPYLQNHSYQQAQTGEKQNTITQKEFQILEKKSKEQLNQIYCFEVVIRRENKSVKLKQSRNSTSMETIVEKCAALQQIIDEQSIINSKLNVEIGLFKQQNEQLKEDIRVCYQELKELRIISQEKFRLESELQQALTVVAEQDNKSNMLDLNKLLNQELSEKNKKQFEELESLGKQLKQIEKQKQKIQEKLNDTIEELEKLKNLHYISQQEQDQKNAKLIGLERLLQSQLQDFSILESQYKDSIKNCQILKQQLDELYIISNREIDELNKDRQQKEQRIKQMQEDIQNLIKDVHIQKDFQARQKQVSNAPLTKKDKIVVESLANRVQELEMLNKTMKDQFSEKIINLKNELEERVSYIQLLAYHLSKAYPNLTESDLIEKEDIKVIQQLKKRQNIQEILEKTMIENLQLREQIKLLGAELNKKK
ncbi:unnamed protein product [Paramecium pentaurelia]|uniref:Uncharacterized protein n=1 Tax=Paramecium pentaurelia TaxID=43138 RepID=A0A8S1SQ81_9CILI|nr:unnamed protein product [Paramecium pentaurelia]